MITLLPALRTGLKTGMNFTGLVGKPVSKITFFGVKYIQDLREPGGTPPRRIPRGTPLPPPIDSNCYPRLNK